MPPPTTAQPTGSSVPDDVVIRHASDDDRDAVVALHLDRRRLLSTVGEIEEWLVAEPLRGHGVGRRLFDRMVGELSARGCTAVEVRTWAANTRVASLLRSLGLCPLEVTFGARSRSSRAASTHTAIRPTRRLRTSSERRSRST